MTGVRGEWLGEAGKVVEGRTIGVGLAGCLEATSWRKEGHCLKLAVWEPWQLTHVGVSSGSFLHSLAKWGPEHFTHRGGWPQLKLEWPKH